MSKHEAPFPVFPHDQRVENVRKDGRIYFRTYTPNFVSGMEPSHYFFDTITELCQFIRENYNQLNVRFELRRRHWSFHHNEWLLIGYESTGSHWVLGFCQNLEGIVISKELETAGIPITITEEEERDAETSRT